MDSEANASNCDMSSGNVFRKNNIKNVSDYQKSSWAGSGGVGIGVGSSDAVAEGTWFTANLFENNTFDKCTKVNIQLADRQGKNIFG